MGVPSRTKDTVHEGKSPLIFLSNKIYNSRFSCDRMTLKELQVLLDRGLRLGVVKPTDSPDWLGWILVSKHPSNPRFREVLDELEHAHLLEEQRRRDLAPYLVLNIELKRSVHEEGNYETEDDYRMKTESWCTDLPHVQDVLRSFGVELWQLHDSREIDAP